MVRVYKILLIIISLAFYLKLSANHSARDVRVKDGDTYGCIAEKYYGSFEHWVDIMNSNPVHTDGFSEYELHVGAQLVLPAITADRLKPASALCS